MVTRNSSAANVLMSGSAHLRTGSCELGVACMCALGDPECGGEGEGEGGFIAREGIERGESVVVVEVQ